MHHTTRLLAAAIAVTALGACKSSDNSATTDSTAVGATTTTVTTTPAPDSMHTTSPQALTDSNIVANMEDGDSTEIVLAKLAESKATDAGVKAYAQMLVTDHTKALKDAKALATKTKMTPVPPPNDTTAQETTDLVNRFNGLAKGLAFDTAFVNHEVDDHQQDIAETNQMIAAAQNADVKAELQKDLPVLQKHLDKAKALQGTVRK